MHVGTKLSLFDNKEISASQRFRLDKLTTFLLTNLPFNLFSKRTAGLPFGFLSPSMFSEFLTLEVPFPISNHAFLHEFFEQSCFDSEFSELLFRIIYKFSKSRTIFFLERDAPTTIYFFHFVSCTFFLIFTLCDLGIPIKHGFLNFFPFKQTGIAFT